MATSSDPQLTAAGESIRILGDSSHDVVFRADMVLSCRNVVGSIILLNILIALYNDSYSRVQESSTGKSKVVCARDLCQSLTMRPCEIDYHLATLAGKTVSRSTVFDLPARALNFYFSFPIHRSV